MNFLDKSKLGTTNLIDFIRFSNVGGDYMYNRYDTVSTVVNRYLKAPYNAFLAQPVIDKTQGSIDWYVPTWKETPVRFDQLPSDKKDQYQSIKQDTLNQYQSVLNIAQLDHLQILRDAIKDISDDRLYCYDGKMVMLAWGMEHNKERSPFVPIKGVPIEKKKWKISFSNGEHGNLKNALERERYFSEGKELSMDEFPIVIPNDGYEFLGWSPSPEGYIVNSEAQFTATFKQIVQDIVPPIIDEEPQLDELEPDMVHCQFVTGDEGTMEGLCDFERPRNHTLSNDEVPKITPQKGYKFTGWSVDTNAPLTEDTTFTAQYAILKLPWYKRLWNWFKKYWWILLLILLGLLLFFLLLHSCRGCTRHYGNIYQGPEDVTIGHDDPNIGRGGIYNPGDPYTTVPTDPGYADVLPPTQGVLPPSDRQEILPGDPTIVGNYLNIMLDNDNKKIGDLARKFKQVYSGDQYQVIYYDDVVKLMQIQVPSSERETIKQNLPGQMSPEFTTDEVFVFDETRFESHYAPNDPAFSNANLSWYLHQIKVPEAWDLTKGSNEITVAVVDNGFNTSHPEFKGKVVQPYNVWTHSKDVFPQKIDHGTHVAGTAIGIIDNKEGLCGIAPNCMFCPVQVADKSGAMTTMAVLNGILYSIYQGADVINVSLGMMFQGLSAFPESQQQELIRNHFKEEERLWKKISTMADKHKAVIVVAAGNDNVLAGIEPLQRPDNIIVVSAVDRKNNSLQKASFSNYGEFADISAPGVDIYSSYGKGYKVLEGTSMASPIVAGTIALMKSLNRSLTASQCLCILQSTGIVTNNNVGNLIQVEPALQKVKSGEECVLSNNSQSDIERISIGDTVVSIHHGDVEIML